MAALLKACDALMEASSLHSMGMLFRLMLDTGLRKGEALALTWADLDLAATPPQLSVSKAWSNLKGVKGGIMTKPKSKCSRRVVPIPPSTAQRLRALRAATRETYGEDIAAHFLFGPPSATPPSSPTPPTTP